MARAVCWRATTAQDRGWHMAIRHRVFVEDQRIIPFTDVDDHDRHAATVHVLGGNGPAAVGTVRCYPTNAGVAHLSPSPEHQPGSGSPWASGGRWTGDRLAVLKGHATSLIGARLVRFAVAWAAACGGEVMDAKVQLPNVRFFERLGWQQDGNQIDYYGLAHQPMIIELATARKVRFETCPSDARLELPAPRNAPSALLTQPLPTAV